MISIFETYKEEVKTMNDKMTEYIIGRLTTLYPDRMVISLHEKDNHLYRLAKEKAEKHGIKLNDWLASNGFTHVRKPNESKIAAYDSFIEELQATFPDRIVLKLSTDHPVLYRRLFYASRTKGMNVESFVESMGFYYNRIPAGSIVVPDGNNVYDVKTMELLMNDYGVKQTEWAELFGVSRQAIGSLLKRRRKSNASWVEEDLTEEEESIFLEMINRFEVSNDSTNTKYRIYSNENEQFVFLVNNNRHMKVVFDGTVDLQKALKHQLYHVFPPYDLERLKQLLESALKDGHEERGMDDNEMRLIRELTQGKTHGFNHEKLLEHFGIQHLRIIDRRFIGDDEILDILKSFYDEELGTVKIPLSSNQYSRIVMLAKNRGFSLKDFIEHFGLPYKRIPQTNTLEKYRSLLIQRYAVMPGEVYISSYDPFYSALSLQAYKKEMNLTDYLWDTYGLKRVLYEYLPEGYKPYDWRNYIVDIDKEEEFILFIENHYVIKDNFIYIPSNSIFYAKLYFYGVRFERTVTELIESWGFERIYNPPEDFVVEEVDPNIALDFREDLLSRLKNVQSALGKTQVVEEKRNRSRELVKLLKELYLDRCQLCEDSDGVPVIRMENGREYVEVHHIIQLSTATSTNDESELLLDSYQNVIVVCPHHHKVLHYENGGYEDLNWNDGVPQFKNKKGMLKIHTNYHLEPRI